MKFLFRSLVIVLCLLLIPISAVVTSAIKQRFEDGPNRVFSGGPLISGPIYEGAEPDWEFVNTIDTVELQLLEPPLSRRIWIASAQGRLFVWSGYMNSLVGQFWKTWPAQAEADGRALLRIDGIRYERNLRRLTDDRAFEELSAVVSEKYPSRFTRDSVDRGDVWVFEAKPKTRVIDSIKKGT